MKPVDLGFPAKFTSWRSGQDDAIIDASSSLLDKRFYVSSQPTGAGKSAFCVGVAQLLGASRTLILTATKALQQQYLRDFASMGMVEIKGQNNYQCYAVARPNGLPGVGELHGMAPENSRCDDGPCHAGVECSLKGKGCSYFDQVRTAIKSNIVVTNYSYWFYTNRFGIDQPLGLFDLLVLDEAHDAADKLSEFVSVHLGRDELADLLGVELPSLDADVGHWAEWARIHWKQAEEELEATKGGGHVRTIRALRNLASKLEDLSKADQWKRGNPPSPNVRIAGQSTDWVAEESDGGALFSPVWAHGYAEKFLFADVPRVILTSATIVPKTLGYLGLEPDQFTWNERASTFKAERRPVYVVEGSVKVSARMSRGEEMVWMNKLDAILDTRLDRKAIVHAVSYDRARFIYENSRHRSKMFIHSSRDTVQQVERFKKAIAPAILISPTVREGWDFPYCVAPDTKILTSDLRWVEAGSIAVGDKLAGFDENPLVSGIRGRRKWRESTVTHLYRTEMPCYELKFNDGTEVVCSEDHSWLTHRGKTTKWVKTKHLGLGKIASRVAKLLDVWGPLDPYSMGYLAAAYDGEGHLYQGIGSELRGPNARTTSLNFTQRDNLMLDEVERLLLDNNFRYTKRHKIREIYTLSMMHRIDILRFLGQIRPHRLLPKFVWESIGNLKYTSATVVYKRFIGLRPVIAFSTDTKTFIANGLASHNSECELQIIAKIPFVDSRPAVIQARHKGDKLYTNYLAIMALIQSAGRGMRAEDDFCETFIIDDNIRWLLQSVKNILPKWFKSAIRRVQTIPPPPQIRARRITR